jgi:hypothetical protein
VKRTSTTMGSPTKTTTSVAGTMAGPSSGRKPPLSKDHEPSERAPPKKHSRGEKLQLFPSRSSAAGSPSTETPILTVTKNEKRAPTKSKRPLHPPAKPKPPESSPVSFQWHRDILHALRSGRWEHVRGQICLYNAGTEERLIRRSQQSSSSSSKPASRFLWKRRQAKVQHDELVDTLLGADEQGRTPLLFALETSHTPPDVLLQLIRACPAAARMAVAEGRSSEAEDKKSPARHSTNKRNVPIPSPPLAHAQSDSSVGRPQHSRLPLHLAVINDYDLQVIAALVDAHPPALSAADEKGKIPLHYAVEVARSKSGGNHGRHTNKLYWMAPLTSETSLQSWQQEQSEAWGVAHWLLLSSATHQTRLDVDGALSGSTTHHADNRSRSKVASSGDLSMGALLVDALLSAAPPGVIALFLGVTSSASPLPALKDRSLFSAATIYTCLTRHYPLSILQGIVSCCSAKTIQDLGSVRDETNMGLVSACFISGCFAQNEKTTEWNVVPRIWGTLKSILEQGRTGSGQPSQSLISGSIDKLSSDHGFVEWWETLEYLLKLCDADDPETTTLRSTGSRRVSQAKDCWLVHAALRNSDTPPWVFRMLTVLYPTQLRQPNRRTGAWPIHMAAQQADYIPRNYEFQIVDHRSTSGSVSRGDHSFGSEFVPSSSASPCGVLVSIDRTSIYKRHRGRLPLHYAIDVGKTLPSLQPLIDNYTLRCRDPSTHLFPFQQAATYCIGSTQDGWRWSCSARNKYSHAVWKGLTDRQKAEAIWRVAQAEDTLRLSTIFVMLKRNPKLMHAGSGSGLMVNADLSRTNMVSNHYLSLFRGSQKSNQTSIIDCAISDAAVNGGQFTNATKDFLKWLQKLKFWIRYCEPPVPLPSIASIPRDGDEHFLVHAAVSNPDTPPKVVQLLLALLPSSTHRSLPSTKILPLHLAALTSPNVRSDTNLNRSSCIDMLVRDHPMAASCQSELGWPLHLAIKSGQSWDVVQQIVDADPSVLCKRDNESHLYPFQLAAVTQDQTLERYCRVYSTTTKREDEAEGNCLTPLQQVREIRAATKAHSLDRLTTVFALLRRDASVIGRDINRRMMLEAMVPGYYTARDEPRARHTIDGSVLAFETYATEMETGDCGHESQSIVCSDSANSETGGSDSENDDLLCSRASIETNSNAGKVNGKERPSLLSYFARTTSQHDSYVAKHRGDASILSGVDVMSLVSGVSFANPRHGRSIASEEKSLNLADLLVDTSSSHECSSESTNDEETSAEFAEESASEDSTSIVADPIDDNESRTDSNSESLVFFLMRRNSSVRRTHAEERETTKQVMLSKKEDDRSVPLRSRSMPIDQSLPKDSLRAMLFSSRHNRVVQASRSMHSAYSSQSTSTGNDSFNSMLPEELGKVGSSTTMMWVSNNLHDKKMLSQAAFSQTNSSKTSDDESFFSHNSSYASLRRAASGSGRISSQGSCRSLVASQASNDSDSPRSSASVGQRSTVSRSRSSHNSLNETSRSLSRKTRRSDDGSVASSSEPRRFSSAQSQTCSSSKTTRSRSPQSSSSSHALGSGNSRRRQSQSFHSEASDASTEIGILDSSVSSTPTGTGTSSFSTFANDGYDDSSHIFGALGTSSYRNQRHASSTTDSSDCLCLPFLDLEGREEDPFDTLDLSPLGLPGNRDSCRVEFATFDKATMRWTARVGDQANRFAEKNAPSRHLPPQRVDTIFDKKTMKWIPRSDPRYARDSVANNGSSTYGLDDKTGCNESGTVHLGLPFVDMMPPKVKQKDRRVGL